MIPYKRFLSLVFSFLSISISIVTTFGQENPSLKLRLIASNTNNIQTTVQEVTNLYLSNSTQISSPDVTIFIGGAGFKGKEKGKRKFKNFTQNLLYTFKNIFNKSGTYYTAKKGKRFLGSIQNSAYSIKFGDKPVGTKIKKHKHRALRKTYNEIAKFYGLNGFRRMDSLSIIGSSYGSVLAGQVAIRMVEECGQTIKSLTLSASPIDKFSKLGYALRMHEKDGKIGKLIWQPNKDDNISGASGNLSLWRIMFPKKSSGDKSIFNPSHPHNLAMKDITRTSIIVQKTILDGSSEGPFVKRAALQFFIDAIKKNETPEH